MQTAKKVAIASQCTSLLRCLCFWLGLLSFKQRQRIFLDGIMNRYISIFDYCLYKILVLILAPILSIDFNAFTTSSDAQSPVAMFTSSSMSP